MLPHPLHPSVAFLYPLKILSCFKSVFWTKTLKFKLFRRYLKRSKKRALLLSPCSAKFLRLFFLKITMQLVQEFLKFLEALMYVTALSCIYFCFAWKGTLRPENFVTCHIVFFKYVPLLTIFFLHSPEYSFKLCCNFDHDIFDLHKGFVQLWFASSAFLNSVRLENFKIMFDFPWFLYFSWNVLSSIVIVVSSHFTHVQQWRDKVEQMFNYIINLQNRRLLSQKKIQILMANMMSQMWPSRRFRISKEK